MNLKSIAAVTLTLIATSALAAPSGESSCGAGSCSKKTTSTGADSTKPDAACSKRMKPPAAKKTKPAAARKKALVLKLANKEREQAHGRFGISTRHDGLGHDDGAGRFF